MWLTSSLNWLATIAVRNLTTFPWTEEQFIANQGVRRRAWYLQHPFTVIISKDWQQLSESCVLPNRYYPRLTLPPLYLASINNTNSIRHLEKGPLTGCTYFHCYFINAFIPAGLWWRCGKLPFFISLSRYLAAHYPPVSLPQFLCRAAASPWASQVQSMTCALTDLVGGPARPAHAPSKVEGGLRSVLGGGKNVIPFNPDF